LIISLLRLHLITEKAIGDFYANICLFGGHIMPLLISCYHVKLYEISNPAKAQRDDVYFIGGG